MTLFPFFIEWQLWCKFCTYDNAPATWNLNFIVGREALVECSSSLLHIPIPCRSNAAGLEACGGAEWPGDFLALECSWNFFSAWHLWKVNRYKTWWKSQQHQGPSLIAYLLCCLFSREISLNKKQEMLQYLSHFGQGFQKFKISSASENSLFWKHGNSSSEHYWENCFLVYCFVQNSFVNKHTN